MKIIDAKEFDSCRGSSLTASTEKDATEAAVREIVGAVAREGDKAVQRYAARFDRSSPLNLEIPMEKIQAARRNLETEDPAFVKALRFSAKNILKFSQKQREQFRDFEFEIEPGLFTGQRTVPVQRAGVYVPGGRYPLISSALMCLIPAFAAGVDEVCLASPPGDNGLPDPRILAAAAIAVETCAGFSSENPAGLPVKSKDSGAETPGPVPGPRFRAFAMGGAQALAALALGTETVPACDVIAGPGNKYVAGAKRVLFGETGIDIIAGPSDILVIMDEFSSPDLAGADMLAQAEHDIDARARALVPSQDAAKSLVRALETRLAASDAAGSVKTARASLDSGGLIVVYSSKTEALRVANAIAPEHLELQTADPGAWIPGLRNYGSLFIGNCSAEVLGDYSSGLNHTLPTSGSARFSGGYSVRYFLKTLTTLRGEPGAGYHAALEAAELMGRAENLIFHAESAGLRLKTNG